MRKSEGLLGYRNLQRAVRAKYSKCEDSQGATGRKGGDKVCTGVEGEVRARRGVREGAAGAAEA